MMQFHLFISLFVIVCVLTVNSKRGTYNLDFPVEPTADELNAYQSDQKEALQQFMGTVLLKNSKEANLCHVLDNVLIDEAIKISNSLLTVLPKNPSRSKEADYMDVFIANAPQLVTFSDGLGQLCATMTRFTHPQQLETLEKLARNSFQAAVDSKDDPREQFAVLVLAVKHLAKLFSKSSSQ